ncbi:MAG: Fic family protein [Nanoarchaeota archaeon]|nr:Fic family protein [Nanoarchaeota archaeon]
MRIIKRKKGKKEYFYLQHSAREKGKVITKEKYLGKIIPKDISKIINTFKKEFKGQDIDAKLEKIKKGFQKEWKKLPESAKEKQLQEISIAFTYNTNAVEGSTITLDETREITKGISPNKPTRDIKETEAHNQIFLEMLKNKEKLTIKLILFWHNEIFKQTKQDIAGKFRKYFVTIAGHIAPDYRKINQLMKNMIKYTKQKNKHNPVELTARTHYRFEKIHPFGDGNGRIGRLLMNYMLWYNGCPMLIIEYKKRKAYYKALRKDEDKFTTYFLRKYLAIHKRYL